MVIVEQVFQLNGMGRVSVESIFRREYPTVQYGVVILALVYVFVNFFVDLAHTHGSIHASATPGCWAERGGDRWPS